MERSHLTVAMKLVGLVKPLMLFMILAVVLGVCGHLAAIVITVFASVAMVNLFDSSLGLAFSTALFAIGMLPLCRAAFAECEHLVTHYIALM